MFAILCPYFVASLPPTHQFLYSSKNTMQGVEFFQFPNVEEEHIYHLRSKVVC